MQTIGTPDSLFHDGGDPTTGEIGTIVTAAIMNAIQSEIISPITAAGIALDPTNNGQLLAAILALIESKTGNYGLDTGAANAYATALTPPVQAYTNGLPIKFRAAHANTGQSTVNAGGGAVPLLRDDGTPLVTGDIPGNGIVSATFDTGVNAFLINSIVASQFDAIVQAGSPTYAPDTGAANAYKASYTPTVTTLTDGMKLRFRAKNTNTTASTFAPDTVPAAPIWGGDHAPLTGSEIVVNGEVEVQWNAVINGGNGAWVLCENTAGYQKGPTPPQFDNSNRYATMSALQQALGLRNAIFTSSGTFTVPANVTTIWYSGSGGGGGGGGSGGISGVSNWAATGGGGGGAPGQWARRVPLAVTPGQVLTVTIGAGGAGGAYGAAGVAGGSGAFGGNTTITGVGVNVTFAGGAGGNGSGANNTSSLSGGPGASGGNGASDGGWGVAVSGYGSNFGGSAGLGGNTPFGQSSGSRAFGVGVDRTGIGYGSGGGGGPGSLTSSSSTGNSGMPGQQGFVEFEW